MPFIPNILFLVCFDLLLFDKYCQSIYKCWDTGFIYCCLCNVLIIATKSTMLQLYLFISLNMPLQFFSNLLNITHDVDLQYDIFVILHQYFNRQNHIYVISYHQAKLFNIIILDLSLIVFSYISLFKDIFDICDIHYFPYTSRKTHCTSIALYSFWVI